jgi:hypothetical protein
MKVIHHIRNHPAVKKAVAATNQHKLTAMLILSVMAALVLVGFSVGAYYFGGFYRYDLSRPGYEKERTEVARPEPQKDYDTTSLVTRSTIDDFLQEFDNRQKDLKAYGDYRDQALSDTDLQLTGTQASQ